MSQCIFTGTYLTWHLIVLNSVSIMVKIPKINYIFLWRKYSNFILFITGQGDMTSGVINPVKHNAGDNGVINHNLTTTSDLQQNAIFHVNFK